MATAIIYAAGSGRVRRIVSDADLSEMLWTDANGVEYPGHTDDGEAAVLWTLDNVADGALPSRDQAAAFVEYVTGKPVPSSRCVALDENNTVIFALMADPLLDTYEGNLIVQDDDAQVGQTLQSDGTWL